MNRSNTNPCLIGYFDPKWFEKPFHQSNPIDLVEIKKKSEKYNNKSFNWTVKNITWEGKGFVYKSLWSVANSLILETTGWVIKKYCGKRCKTIRILLIFLEILLKTDRKRPIYLFIYEFLPRIASSILMNYYQQGPSLQNIYNGV